VDTSEIPAGELAVDRFTVSGDVTITRTASAFDPAELARLAALIDRRRGGVLSSGMEYPGRYSRWHLAYVNPPVEIVCSGRRVTARALNQRGLVLMPLIREAMLRAGVEVLHPADNSIKRPAPEARGLQASAPESASAPQAGGLATVTVDVPEGVGTFTEEERSRRPTVFSVLREIGAAFGCADPHLGLYGAFGYDLAFQFEPVRPALDRSDDQRDLVLHLPDEIWVVDLRRDEAVCFRYEFAVAGTGEGAAAGDSVSTEGLPRETAATPEPRVAAGPLPPQPVAGRYAAVVGQAKERFKRGDLFEVVPGHVFYERCASPSRFYDRLRERNPAPFEFLFNLGPTAAGQGEYLVGASPEMYVRVTGDRVETCPISGTIARGADPLEDAANIARLLGSAKEESELTMCTDVDRNDKSRVCVPGTVRVIGRRQIEMYSRLIHTVDHIEGRLRPGFDALDAFLTHMWAVTVTGAPKAWAMQFIEDNETERRRWYGGAVGKIGFDGSMNTGLTLRTARIADGIAAVRAGATLLYDSDPDAEERETHIKARALLETLREVEEGRLAAERALAGPDGEEVAADASADYVLERAAPPPLRVLLVDHQDSFVHTLADYFRQHDAEVTTLRAGFQAALLDELAPDLVVLSPGPGRPADFHCDALLTELDARGLPAFGVCLGLQAMVEHAGGELSLLPEPQHGKPGSIRVHEGGGGGLLAGLPPTFTAARYHSLYAREADVKAGFTVTATTPDGAVMAIEDSAAGRWAVQFHPESILTAAGRSGHLVIANVLAQCRARTTTDTSTATVTVTG
jgi:anthranilate synthase